MIPVSSGMIMPELHGLYVLHFSNLPTDIELVRRERLPLYGLR